MPIQGQGEVLTSLAVHWQCRLAGSLPSGLSAYATANADEKTPGGCSDLVRLVRLNL